MHARLLAFFAACLLVVVTAPAAISDAEISPAIREFLNDPLSPSADSLAKKIITFAEESPNHEIVIDPKYLPWLQEEKQSESSALLLAAYCAGNLKAQIESGTSSPKSYKGILAVIDAYEKIRGKQKGFRIASIDHFIELEGQGRLRSHIEKE